MLIKSLFGINLILNVYKKKGIILQKNQITSTNFPPTYNERNTPEIEKIFQHTILIT